MDLSDLGTLVTVAAIAVFAVPVVLAAISIVIVVANRAEPDGSGRRPVAVYLFAVSFLAVFAALLSSYGIVRELCRLIVPHAGGSGLGDDGSDGTSGNGLFGSSGLRAVRDAPIVKHPLGDSIARGCVALGIVLLIAGVVLLLHLRAGDRVSRDELATSGPVARVRQSYVAAVSFLCLVIAVVSLGLAIYRVFGLVSPTVFDAANAPSHKAALRGLVPSAYLAVAAVGVLVLHLRWTPPAQRPDFSGLPFRGRPAPAAPEHLTDLTPPAEAPTAPVVTDAPPPIAPEVPRTTTRRRTSTAGGEVLGDAPARRRSRPKPGG